MKIFSSFYVMVIIVSSCSSNSKTTKNIEVFDERNVKSSLQSKTLNDTINDFIDSFMGEKSTLEKIDKREKDIIFDSTLNAINLRILWNKEGIVLEWKYKEKQQKLILNKDIHVGYVNTELITPFTFITADLFAIRFGCGSPCWYDILLPLNGGYAPEKVDYLMYLDNNFYVKLGDDNYSVIIVNYKQKRSYKVKIRIPKNWESRNGGFLPAMVDYIKIKNDTIELGQYKNNESIKMNLKFK
jgi:hypothetical protein